MRKTAILLLLSGVLTTAMAQHSKWGISFIPAILTSTRVHFGLQAGAEYRINERVSILTEWAVPVGGAIDSSTSHLQYFRIKPEIRYLLSKRESSLRFYAGFQGSYSFRQWKDLQDGIYFNQKLSEDTATRYSSAKISSPVFTASAQLGAFIHLGPNFCIDVFMGMGARVIDTKYSEVENPSKDIYFRRSCKIFPSPDPAYWINGTVFRFHSNTGIRFLYRF